MHAAAAFGVPAVIVRGAFVSHRVTGYASQRNLYTGDSELGCGMRVACRCCAAAMEKIRPVDVVDELRGLLNGR